IIAGYKPETLIVFDYTPKDDWQRERYDAAKQRLAEAGCTTRIDTLDALCERGKDLSPAPLFAAPAGGNPPSTIFYTSGSTGTPKGAMYRERMILTAWQGISPTPVICVNYMPMNHAFGRSMVFTALGNGGTCYFTAKSDLSTFFDDIRMVRPTQM